MTKATAGFIFYRMLTSRNIAALALAAFVCLAALTAGCGRKQEPPAAPAPAKLAPIAPAPGETPSSALIKKEEAPHIKVRRDKGGDYTWEITGKDVRAIIETDRALRRHFEPKVSPESD